MLGSFRSYFPFFTSHEATKQAPNGGSPFVYLDSAATTQKHQEVLRKTQDYHLHFNANVHRGGYSIAQQATNEYEYARQSVADFIGANSAQEVIFTSGTTEAINIIAHGMSADMITGNDIVICGSEHHANLVPWQQLAHRLGMNIVVLPLSENGEYEEKQLSEWLSLITTQTAVVAVAHVSNALGNIYPVEALCEQARKMGALSVIDGTQAAAHIAINVSAINCDFYALSGHKMYANTGIGVLYGKYNGLLSLLPSKFGGEMISDVSWNTSCFQAPPLKFEGGTPNIAGALSLVPAMAFINEHREIINAHEMHLYQYLMNQLKCLSAIQMIGNDSNSIPIIAFNVKDYHANDIAIALARKNVAVRAGHHCAMPLMKFLNIAGCVRISIACYNTLQDIDIFVGRLKNVLTELNADGDNINHPPVALHQAEKIQNNNTYAEQVSLLASRFSATRDWNEKHRLLLLHSKNLPTLAPSLRSDINALSGCEANVWLDVIAVEGGIKILAGYSDSKVVRGLLALLLTKANALSVSVIEDAKGNNKEEIQASLKDTLYAFLDDLGLPHYFSQGRKDGMFEVIKRIESLLL